MRTSGMMMIAALLTGCFQPKLLRHYEKLESGSTEKKIELAVFVANPSSQEPTALLAGIGERGQAELIKALALKVPDKDGAKSLIDFLHKPPEDAGPPCAWVVKENVKKRLVISLLGEMKKPSDRVDKLDVVLKLRVKDKDGNKTHPRAMFVSWDKFDPVSKTYDIGSATISQSNKLILGKSKDMQTNLPEGAGTIAKLLSLGAETERSWEESAKYGLTRLSVGGSLTDTTARLVQEGGPNFNLFGASSATITINLELSTNPSSVYKFTLRNEEKEFDAEDVLIERCEDRYPVKREKIVADVSGEIWVREVLSGDETVPEGDDSVRLYKKNIEGNTVTLMSEQNLSVARYGLGKCPPKANLDDCDFLQIERDGATAAEAEPLMFATAAEVVALRSWLILRSKKLPVKMIGGYSIGVARRDPELTSRSLKGVSSLNAIKLRVVADFKN